MANIPILAMFFGLIMTIQLHIAKAMEKQGIEVFDQIKAKLKKVDNINSNIKKPIIYTIGMILHNTVWIYQILGTSYGLASHVTSMFGLGLFVLMIYSSKILKENITRIEYIGSCILVIGTVIIGIENLKQSSIERASINTNVALIITGTFIISGFALLWYAILKKNPFLTGIIFGFVSGGWGTFDPIFKELGLTFEGGNNITPSHPIGWFLYIFSFIAGFIALVLTQWGFARQAKASVLIPVYNSVYITFPIFLQLFTVANYIPSIFTVIGIILTILGIVSMQYSKNFNRSKESKDKFIIF